MKRLVKRAILQMLSLFCRDDGPHVVYYHDIGVAHTKMGTNSELFKAHVSTARTQGYDFVRGDDLLESVDGKKKLLLCFDDGFRGIYESREYLLAENLFPIVFIAIELVGQRGYLTWEEIRSLQECGVVFASHTWSHRSLTEVKPFELKHELFDSREELEQRLGHKVDWLCFPRGLFSLRVLDACEEAGYSMLFTSVPGDADRTIAVPGYSGVARLVPRNLAQAASVGEFRCILRGAMTPLQGRYLCKHFVVD